MTNPHNFTLDRKTEALWEEFQDLARKSHTNVSELFRKFIVDYVESKNLKVVKTMGIKWPYRPGGILMLEQKDMDPYPSTRKEREAWMLKYPRKVTVNYGK